MRRRLVAVATISVLTLTALLQPFFHLVPPSQAVSTTIVISQVYGGGGNGGATLTNDFIELFNRGNTTVSLSGWSVQYASAAGTTWAVTSLTNVSLAPGRYYLVQEAVGAGGTQPLPTPDATGTIAMSATAGKVALVNTTTALSGACPTGASIVDVVGYGATASCFEGSGPTTAPSNTTSVVRGGNGCTDTDNNATDFTASAGVPVAHNTSSALAPCAGPANQPIVPNCPGTLSTPQGTATSANVSATDADGAVTSATITSANVPGITLDGFTPASGVGQPATATLNVSNTTAPGTYNVTIQYANNDATPQTATCTIAVTIVSNSITLIHDIQGSIETPQFVGSAVTVRGIVVGDYQGASGLSGFFVEEENSDWDANAATSEGIFIFQSNTSPTTAVNLGDDVTVAGTVSNSFNLTQITATSISVNSTGSPLPNAATVTLPVQTSAAVDLEPFEGMRVTFNQTLYVTEVFDLGRFGEISVSVNGPQFVPTNFVDPNDNPASGVNTTGGSNVAAITAQQSLYDRSRFIIDDGSSNSNTSTTNPLTPVPYLLPSGTLRRGDFITNATGVINFTFSNYKLEPAPTVTFTQGNPRPSAPAIVPGSNARLASFNVENYFVTTGTGRGAANAAELNRQRAKIVAALAGLNADVIGLVELEKANGNAAAADLATGLNNLLGTPGDYVAVADLATLNGTDPDIKNGMIYRRSTVTPFGGPFTDTVAANGSYSRDPLAQIFKLNSNGRAFTVLVQHSRSKSCPGTGADADQNDGQSCFNDRRRQQSQLIVNFINSQSSRTADILVVGDFNSYSEEDPIDVLRAGGLQDVISQFVPASSKYSFTFQGQTGQLDHGFATSSLAARSTGATIWHIDADEPPIIDYTLANKPDDRYQPTPYRASDHDPIVMSFNLALPTAAGTELSGQVTTPDGQPLAGVVINLSGPKQARAITDAQGNYKFENLESGSFYTVAPMLANFAFSPAERSFSLNANKTDAVFTATLNAFNLSNPLDTDMYFVRQQYLDFLGREADTGGLQYWTTELEKCGTDAL
ncbi:MAG: uncharacterized protein QOD00_4105, partial [Blastocatellia bacterium]|nr:uncharacterized protein [Blastocatellia bacterium]